jgi:hypothetical protein
MLIVVMLFVILLNVVMLCVVAPQLATGPQRYTNPLDSSLESQIPTS